MGKKIITIILILLLIVSFSLFSYIFIENIKTEKSILNLKENKETIINNNNTIKEETEKLNNELNDLKEELKDKVSEYEVWKETKEKIETIIG